MQNPRDLTVTLTSHLVAYSLLTLLQALDTGFNADTYKKAMRVILQSDPSNGAALVFRGNSDVAYSVTTPVTAGLAIVAGEVDDHMKSDHNEYELDEIYLIATADTALVNVTIAWR